MRFRDLSIRWKLLFINSSASAVALILACAAFTTFDWLSSKDSMVGKLQVLAEVIADNSVSAIVFDDPQTGSETLSALRAEKHIVAAVIYKGQQPFVSYQRDAIDFSPPALQNSGHAFSKKHLDLYQNITYNNGSIGTVFIRSDLQQLENRLNRYLFIGTLFVAIAVAIAAVVGIALQSQISTPIVQLADIARAISEHRDYSVRAPEGNSDEIGTLTTGFNEMIAQVQTRDAELEDQVRRRTVELLEAKEDAEAANQAKSDFLAHISRDLRTPMSSIIGMTELTLEDELQPVQQEYLRTVLESGNNLLVLLNDLLDYSRIETGQMQLRNNVFSLREVFSSPLKGLAPRAHEKGIELILRIAPDAPDALVGDAERLRQIVVNLVGNAIKFTHIGEVFVEVEVVKNSPGELRLEVAISDTGIGISDDKRDLVFTPFARANIEEARQYSDGTGLGLAICKELLTLMSGHISLQSKEGQGSIFRFDLPCKAAPASTNLAFDRSELSNVSALVVEDNTTNRRVLVEMLESWQMRVESAYSGQEALDLLREAADAGTPHALLIADIAMTGMNGIELARKAHADPRFSQLNIILLSATNPRQQDGELSKQLGIAARLSKPVDPSELLRSIYTIFGSVEMHATEKSEAQHHTQLRILLAEDTPANQRFVKAILERRGHSVAIANNGREALTALKRQVFDLVLMDVQMPEMSGLEATEKIRESESQSSKHLPIIALTAFAMEGDEERCLTSGMDAYLAKPFQPTQLIAAMERVLPMENTPSTPPPPPTMPMPTPTTSTPTQDPPASQYDLQRGTDLLEPIWIAIAENDGDSLASVAQNLVEELESTDQREALRLAQQLEALGRAGKIEEAEAITHTLGTVLS